MYDYRIGGQDRYDFRINAGFSALSSLVMGVVLSWGDVHADTHGMATEQTPATAHVIVYTHRQSRTTQNPEASEVVEVKGGESQAIDKNKNTLDVVQLETIKMDQASRLDLAGSRNLQSLDVVVAETSVKLSHAEDDISGDTGRRDVIVGPGDQPGVSEPIGVDPATSDIVQLDARSGDQNSQLQLAGSGGTRALGVVDTEGTVKFPHSVDGDIEDNKAIIEPGDQGATDSNERLAQIDQRIAAGIGVKSPVANGAADPASQLGDAGSQFKNVSDDVASEESTGLPYAVVLALLALIGLVPVARRGDHHHV